MCRFLFWHLVLHWWYFPWLSLAHCFHPVLVSPCMISFILMLVTPLSVGEKKNPHSNYPHWQGFDLRLHIGCDGKSLRYWISFMNGLEAAVSPSIFFLGHRLTLCLSVCILFTSVYSIFLFLLSNILYLTIVFISLSPELQMTSACHIPISYNLPASTSSVNWSGISVVLSSKSLGRDSNYPSLSFSADHGS